MEIDKSDDESTPLVNKETRPNNNAKENGICTRKKYCGPSLFGFFGFLFLSAGIALVFSFRVILEHIIRQKVVLAPDSDVFELWKEPPIPILGKFYFFNVTNKEDFPWHHRKPQLQEIGPYTFREHWIKVDLQWNPNGTVSYRQIKTYTFEPSLSVGTEDDVISTVNIPLVTAAEMFKTASPFIKLALTSMFHLFGENFIVEKKVRELLFEGYSDPLITISREILKTYPYMKFGLLFGRNGSDDGTYTVHTGVDNSKSFSVIDKWNGGSTMHYWKSGFCNMINGTDGATYPPLVSSNEFTSIYSTDLCRTFRLKYSKSLESHNIPVYRFLPTEDLFESGAELTQNQCYCSDRCLKSGVFNLSLCQFGAPIFASYPHFYKADPWYLQNVDGLSPNQTLHETHFDIEPITGVPVDLSVSFQMNAFIENIEGLSFFESLNEMMFPLIWFNQVAEIDEAVENLIVSSTQKPYYYSRVISFAFMGLGMILLIVAILYLIISRKHERQRMLRSQTYVN